MFIPGLNIDVHFCADELLALQTAFPFASDWLRRMHAWWVVKFPKHACHANVNCEELPEVKSDLLKENSS